MTKLLSSISLIFLVQFGYSQEMLLLKSDGKVVIGDTMIITTPGDYGLYVEDGILTERVKVALKSSAEWSDNAWERRPELREIEQSILNNRHLVGIPSAEKLVKDGYELKSMDAKLLAQIEWMWTYILEQEERNNQLEERLDRLEKALKNK